MPQASAHSSDEAHRPSKRPRFERISFESLLPIVISDLTPGEVHRGRYLVCRTTSEAAHEVNFQATVEDQNRTIAEIVLLHCFETQGLSQNEASKIIPVGQVILIREPWLRSTESEPEAHVICVNTPSVVSLLEHNHPILDTFPDDWNALCNPDIKFYQAAGDTAAKNGNLEAAVLAYTTALTINADAPLIRLNRSACHLKLGNLSLALQDAQTALESKALPRRSRDKALHAVASVYYAMDRFRHALDILSGSTSARSWPKYIESFRERARNRLSEQEQGSYDWLALRKIANEIGGRSQIEDVADYVGPVKVVGVSGVGGGRGLVTTKAVMAGELLLVAKPYAFASPSEIYEEIKPESEDTKAAPNANAYHELIGRVARRLMGDHTAASALLLDLYSGNADEALPHVHEAALPRFLTHGGCHWKVPGEYSIPNIGIDKVKSIADHNRWSNTLERLSTAGDAPTTVYLLPSLINHACYGTAIGTQVGSLLIVRASRNMKNGEAVTMSFAGGQVYASYRTRAEAFVSWRNITKCQCDLCHSDYQDGEEQCKEREEYDSKLDINHDELEASPFNKHLRDQLHELVDKIRGTYNPGRIAPMETLAIAQTDLAKMYHHYWQDPKQAIQSYVSALRSFGIHVKDVPPEHLPRNNSELHRNALIIKTHKFPSLIDRIYRCVENMEALSSLQHEQGDVNLAGHWAIACLWTHEAFYGKGKEYLFLTLGIESDSPHPLVELLENFN